jgi:hypothetical protein
MRMFKKTIQQGRSERRPEAWHSSPTHPELPRQLVSQVGYVEDAFMARTTLGARRVSARQGWAGEKRGFFNILTRHYPPCRRSKAY